MKYQTLQCCFLSLLLAGGGSRRAIARFEDVIQRDGRMEEQVEQDKHLDVRRVGHNRGRILGYSH